MCLRDCVCSQGEAATGYLAQHQLFDQVMFCFCDLARPGHVLRVSVFIHITEYGALFSQVHKYLYIGIIYIIVILAVTVRDTA